MSEVIERLPANWQEVYYSLHQEGFDWQASQFASDITALLGELAELRALVRDLHMMGVNEYYNDDESPPPLAYEQSVLNRLTKVGERLNG